MSIKIEDVEIVIKEMLEKDLVITPDHICDYMGLKPIESLPPINGELPKYVYNNSTVYSCIFNLRKLYVQWHKKRNECYEKWKIDWKKAVKWDPKQGKMIYHHKVITYKTFVDERMESLGLPKGLLLIPIPIEGEERSNTYIIPNKEEERIWVKKNIESKGKSFLTTIDTGDGLGHLELDRKGRKFVDKLSSGKVLKYKKEEEENEEENGEENREEKIS